MTSIQVKELETGGLTEREEDKTEGGVAHEAFFATKNGVHARGRRSSTLVWQTRKVLRKGGGSSFHLQLRKRGRSCKQIKRFFFLHQESSYGKGK